MKVMLIKIEPYQWNWALLEEYNNWSSKFWYMENSVSNCN